MKRFVMLAFLAVASAVMAEFAGVVVPLRLTSASGVLSFFSTTTVFGTPLDVTLPAAIVSFFPVAATADIIRRLAEA